MYQSEQVKHLLRVKNERARSFGAWAPKHCDVYVASFSKVPLQDRLEIVRDLWHHGIRADFQYEDGSNLSPEELVAHCKKANINWVVIVKYKSTEAKSTSDLVKVKDVLRKTETEVSRAELAVWLTSEIGEQLRIDHSHISNKVRNKHDIKSKEAAESGKRDYVLSFFPDLIR